ncbi:AfsR/SARP family transcriptional regulator [Plantactinospora mayteni]|uniref:SARP family transcriptional regulator n=1 Tax=Plantactinospora mayteni TaxID=566021 RepID=A0ABQ4F382_9ACTN|nr:BTAD domain-containing putative transcriptional regulator [Plantactinospora mayteni]GIH01355.1 SARP family transcriptional regulator [Plantactinospora mayteni]
MEFGVLGPLEIRDQGQALVLGVPRVRAIGGILLVRPGSLVGIEQFVDELWPDSPPADARALVRGYVYRLRRALRAGPSGPVAAARLVARKPGYLLDAGESEVDLCRFAQLVAEARAAARDGHHRRGVDLLRHAHGLWRGDPFADVPRTPAIAAAVTWLTEQRLSALEDLFDAALAAADHTGVVTELTAHVTTHPLRERPVAQLMLALYRAGRRADALTRYQDTRRILADELGTDPGPDLQALHRQVLAADPALATPAPDRPAAHLAPARSAPVPRQLPARPALFSGRERELARLTEALDLPGAVVISAIAGTGGVGKTWLALRWAHDNLDRFPDGQLHINLRGFDPSGRPVAPEEAIRTFLDALGLPPAAIPAGLDAQIGLYRSLLHGKRVLVVLDNASDAAQVRPLLPGADTCATIVTSRHQLTGLAATDSAYPLTLGLLSDSDARRLLAARLGEQRLALESDAVSGIVARCARLPLALALVGAYAAARPDLPLAALVAQLDDHHAVLDALAGDDPATDLRAVFSWSFRALTPGAARLFRLLGLHPGPDISRAAAASLGGVPGSGARRLLAELVERHLVVEHPPGRYTLHDLLRAYATEQAHTHEPDEQRRAALHRVLDHYLYTAHAAIVLLAPRRNPVAASPLPPPAAPEHITDHKQALDWLSREHRVLVATVQAAAAGFETHAWRLAYALVGFFNLRGHWHDWHITAHAALDAARQLHDPRLQALAHSWLAELYAWIGRHQDTHIHLEHADRLYDQVADTAGVAYVHLCRGWVYEPQRRYQEALHHSEQALRIYRAIANPRGEADALNNVGWYHAKLGNFEQAVLYCGQALARQQRLGNRAWEARSWDSLGYAHHHLDDYQRAANCYQHALDLFRDTGNLYYQAKVLTRLGEAQDAVGQSDIARRTWQQALDILQELGHPSAQDLRTRLDQRSREVSPSRLPRAVDAR